MLLMCVGKREQIPGAQERDADVHCRDPGACRLRSQRDYGEVRAGKNEGWSVSSTPDPAGRVLNAGAC